MAGRSWLGWTALAVVLAAYAGSQDARIAKSWNEARIKLATHLPASVAVFVAPSIATNANAATPPGAGQTPKTDAGKAPPPGRRAAPPAPVIIEKVKTANLPLRLEGVGSVQAKSTVAVKSRIDGQLMEAAVKEGQAVKAGDLLFRLDARPLEAALKVAEANVVRDKATLEKVMADNARIGDLAAKGYSPKAKFDEAKATLGALEATIKAGEAAIEAARLNIEYTVIRSPITGKVGNVLVHPGNMVKANDTQSLLVITEVAPVYVAFAIPERYLGEVKRLMAAGKMDVDVWTPENRSDKIRGELFFMNNAVDTSTGTITLMATFANTDQKLMPGQFVQASVLLGTLDKVIAVPARAVQVGQKGTFVYVAKDDLTAEFRPVKVGETVEGQSVINSGLAAGETIVVEGQLRIIPGGKLAPKEPPQGGKPKEQS